MIEALIVDDEGLVRKGLRVMLPWEQHGIRIVGEANSAEKAIDFMKSTPVRLLVTDITMPGMSGLELIQYLNDHNWSVKVVILTCHQDFDYIQQALRLGAIDYIVKTQLEDQDLDALLGRISATVNQIEPHYEEKESSPEVSVAMLDKEMHKLIWVFNDEVFESLMTAMQEMRTDHGLRSAAEKWERYIRLAFPAFEGRVSQIDALDHHEVSQITAQRKLLQKWLRASGYSEDILVSIIRAVSFILEGRDEPIKQSGLAKEVNLSQSYFSICFKEIMHISFTTYTQLVSIERAKQLLSTTNQPIYWIAEQCGFTDQRYFSRIFKDLTGILPSEFKQTSI
jgi:two-component system response regulator YesN